MELNRVGGISQGFSNKHEKMKWTEILEVQYEKGEISKEEYDKMKESLEK